jgi:GxxExxY protein
MHCCVIVLTLEVGTVGVRSRSGVGARDLVRVVRSVERQKPVTFQFKGTVFEDALRPDLIVNNTLIVEVKAARVLDPVFARQLLTYLKILNLPLGLLMDFGMATLIAGIRCIAN